MLFHPSWYLAVLLASDQTLFWNFGTWCTPNTGKAWDFTASSRSHNLVFSSVPKLRNPQIIYISIFFFNLELLQPIFSLWSAETLSFRNFSLGRKLGTMGGRAFKLNIVYCSMQIKIPQSHGPNLKSFLVYLVMLFSFQSPNFLSTIKCSQLE